MASSGRHAHVDGDAVAFFDAESLEGVGEFLYFGVELGVGEAANLARLAFPDERGLVAARAVEMAVDAVVAEVELSADEPFGPGKVPFKHLVPRLEPVKFFGRFGPEGFRVFDGFFVQGLVLLKGLDVGLAGELFGRGKDAVFAKSGVEILIGQ